MKSITISHGLRLILDSDEIVADDPGAGTPAMVETVDGKYSATFWCALNEGELDCGGYQLSANQSNWLEQQEDAVSEFLEQFA